MLTEKYKNYKHLKRSAQGRHIHVQRSKEGGIILTPTQIYIKEYANGDEEKAIVDLAHWYGLLGRILPDNTVEMFVRAEDE